MTNVNEPTCFAHNLQILRCVATTTAVLSLAIAVNAADITLNAVNSAEIAVNVATTFASVNTVAAPSVYAAGASTPINAANGVAFNAAFDKAAAVTVSVNTAAMTGSVNAVTATTSVNAAADDLMVLGSISF